MAIFENLEKWFLFVFYLKQFYILFWKKMFCWIFLCPILLSGSFTLYFKVSFIFNVRTDKLPNGNISRRAHMVKVLAYFKRPFAPTKIAQPDNQPIWPKVALHNEFRSQTHTLMTFLDEIKKFISGKIRTENPRHTSLLLYHRPSAP